MTWVAPMKKKVVEKENHLLISFYGGRKDQWRDTLEVVKSLEGRRFDTTSKKWTADKSVKNIKKLEIDGFILEKKAEKLEIKPVDTSKIKINKKEFPSLRNYQIDCLKFIEAAGGKVLIGDEQGTGKTVQSLSYLKWKEDYPALIVVTASTKLQWEQQYYTWTGRTDVEVLNGQSVRTLDKKKSYIINWDILTHWKTELKKVPFKIVIGDEVQAIGNTTSLRTKAFKSIAKKIPKIVTLSGTPIRSKVRQFYPLLNLLLPETFYSSVEFKERYCDPVFNGYTTTYDGASNIEELYQILSQVMLRREKKDVMKELPPKIRNVVPLHLSKKVQDFVLEGSKKEMKEQVNSIKQEIWEKKKKDVVLWIKEFLEENDKLIVFTYHRKTADYLKKEFDKISVLYDGSLSKTQKEKSKKKFIEDKKTKLFIGQVLSAGVGVDGLQKVCSNAAFVEFAWTSTDHAQAEDRLHRMGQNDVVNIFYLPAKDSIEMDFMSALDEQAKVMSGLLNGEEVQESDLFMNLLRKKNEAEMGSYTK